MAQRLGRRNFFALANARKVQGRLSELFRLLARVTGTSHEKLAYQANDWLMRTMRREVRHSAVTAVHAYEDCSLWQFAEAKRLGKACIYDMPIGCYQAWEQAQGELVSRYADWLPPGGLPSSRYVRVDQKRREMELADLVLVPSEFVFDTVRKYYPTKRVALAPYGIDTDKWWPASNRAPRDGITFLFAGQCSLRKGVPLLLEAWRAAGLRDARLRLAGPWRLAEAKQNKLPAGAEWLGPQSEKQLLNEYHGADVLVLPTYFEGRALVIGEALSAGLPVVTTKASGMQEMIDETCGRIVPVGNMDALVDVLRWFNNHGEVLPVMRRAARVSAERANWVGYRHRVNDAVAPFI
jgi:glycosyltransferase involved in cell wall biosynthesis